MRHNSQLPRRIVIVGYGMAGSRLADEIRKHDPPGQYASITIVGEERHLAYNRVMLSALIGGSMTTDSVRLHEPDWANKNLVDLRLGVSAVSIDRTARIVALTDGSQLPYDALVLATGSRAWVPPVAGLLIAGTAVAPGVSAFRTLDDCERIVSSARPGAPVAVLGGGLLGLEAARGLARLGSLVTVVHPVGHVMERQLDPPASRVLTRALNGLGIEFRLGVSATRYSPGEGLELSEGTTIPADLVVVSAGVRAETSLAMAAGLATGSGVLVDDQMRTSDPRIHAVGDCAQHDGAVAGLVQSAWEQASVLASLLTGVDPSARYRGTATVTRLKTEDVDLTTVGEAQNPSSEAEVVQLEDASRGRYAKLVLSADRVTGAILLGVPDAAATITHLYDRRLPAPSDRMALLLGRSMPKQHTCGMCGAAEEDQLETAVVCRCNSVTGARLRAAWRAGARDVDALAAATRATTGCGGCRGTVCGLMETFAAT